MADGAPGSGGAKQRARRVEAELRAADVSRYPDRRWTDLRDRLGRGFSPSPSLVGGAATGGAGESFLRSYGATAGRYGRTGNPFPDAPDAPGRSDPRAMAASEAADVTTRNPSASSSGFEGRSLAAAGAAPREEVFPGRTAVVAMEQDLRGEVVGVWLVRSSGSEGYDATAMKQVERLRSDVLPAPFGAAITEWAFRAEVVVTPLRPGVGGTFDLGFDGIDVERPLEARVRIRPPELVAIRRVEPG